jgi:A/G-specific adenine glycosylase
MKSFPWQILLNWYRRYGRHDYPWRQYDAHDTSGYRVWLAEILLQQTQADRVVPFYNRILSRYPKIQDLVDSTYEEFFSYYQGLGYYSRARNLLKTANIVSTEYSGIFPEDKALLKKLPWVGEYTARAILAFAYGKSLLAWDTNLETIFSRYYRWAKNIKLTEDEKSEIEKDFQNFISRNSKDQPMRSLLTREINNALMDWARIKEPKTANLLDPENYIFTESEFYLSKWFSEVIEKKISVSFPIPDAEIIVILHQNHKEYYSLSIGSYSPFILAASENRDTRWYVQDYFRTRYALEVSVRPVHKKWITKDGKPYIAVNAQIQRGDSSIFEQYSKIEIQTPIELLYSL